MKVNKEVKDVHQNEEHEQQERQVGVLRPQRGHTVFQYDTESGELTKAVFDEVDYDTTNELQNKRITVQEGCMYVSALNVKNAVKKLGKYHGINIQIK